MKRGTRNADSVHCAGLPRVAAKEWLGVLFPEWRMMGDGNGHWHGRVAVLLLLLQVGVTLVFQELPRRENVAAFSLDSKRGKGPLSMPTSAPNPFCNGKRYKYMLSTVRLFIHLA